MRRGILTTAHMTEVTAVPRNVADLLAAWRAADRRWETTPQEDPIFREVGIAVIRAWLAYQAAIEQPHGGEFALVADDDRLFVAASAGIEATLGYAPASVLGRRIEDLAEIEAVADTVDRWAMFIIEGRQDGTFDLLHRDGSVVRLEYQARAHYPIATFHLSRLWPVVQAAD